MNRSQATRILAGLVCAACMLTHAQQAGAEGGGPPPPSIAPTAGEIRIPKAILNRYLEQVHPGYLEWLASGDGPKDCLPAFELYLTLNPVTRFERECFVVLYTGNGR